MNRHAVVAVKGDGVAVACARAADGVVISPYQIDAVRVGERDGARLEDARTRLSVAAASLDAMSPLAVLGRGYALAQDEGGAVLRSSSDVKGGERVRVRLSRGALRCRVEEIERGEVSR